MNALTDVQNHKRQIYCLGNPVQGLTDCINIFKREELISRQKYDDKASQVPSTLSVSVRGEWEPTYRTQLWTDCKRLQHSLWERLTESTPSTVRRQTPVLKLHLQRSTLFSLQFYCYLSCFRGSEADWGRLKGSEAIFGALLVYCTVACLRIPWEPWDLEECALISNTFISVIGMVLS